jgi:hypothetical protein
MISAQFNQKGMAKKPKPSPFSLRLTEEERAYLLAKANGKPLGAYIRAKLLADHETLRQKHLRRPGIDHEALARVLGALGQSRLSSNLNQIAKAANMGALPVDDDLVQELHQACRDISMMRITLIGALGIKPV